MAGDVFRIILQKNVSPFLIRKIIVIPNSSHINNFPYPKGKKSGCQRQPYLRVLKKKLIQMKWLTLNHPVVFNNKM